MVEIGRALQLVDERVERAVGGEGGALKEQLRMRLRADLLVRLQRET
jgi:hypothetical protein